MDKLLAWQKCGFCWKVVCFPQRQWMVTGAAGGRGAAAAPPWGDTEQGSVTTLLPSETANPATVQTSKRNRVPSPCLKSRTQTDSSKMNYFNQHVWFYRVACCLGFLCRKESCDNDDEFTVGWRDELPPGVEGCLRPQRPNHSFLRVTLYLNGQNHVCV